MPSASGYEQAVDVGAFLLFHVVCVQDSNPEDAELVSKYAHDVDAAWQQLDKTSAK